MGAIQYIYVFSIILHIFEGQHLATVQTIDGMVQASPYNLYNLSFVDQLVTNTWGNYHAYLISITLATLGPASLTPLYQYNLFPISNPS